MKKSGFCTAVLATLISCADGSTHSGTAGGSVQFSILSAIKVPNEDEIVFTVKTTNSGNEDYCWLAETFNGKVSPPDPKFLYIDPKGTPINYDPNVPQFTDSPLEPSEYVIIKLNAHTEQTEIFRSWDDMLPVSDSEISRLEVKAGRIIFPCADFIALDLPEKIETTDANTVTEIRKLFTNAESRLVFSKAVPISGTHLSK